MSNESNALPAHMYRDPMEAAMRNEESHCDGCRHLVKLLDREFCGVGRRTLTRCKKFDDKKRG